MGISHCSSPDELHELLSTVFGEHGVKTQVDGDWLRIPGDSAKVQGLIFDLSDVHPLCSTQVEIRFSPWPGTLIVESFSGLAETREERIQQSISYFAANTLHVILQIFLGIDCEEQTNRCAIKSLSGPMTVTDGHFLTRGTADVCDNGEWHAEFQRLLESQILPDGSHWCRLFYAQMDEAPTTLEFLLDNYPWKDAVAAASTLPWPKSKGFLSLRLFFVIQRGIDVGRAIGLMAQHPAEDDERLESLLVDAGFLPMDARRIILIAPIAFGQRLLSKMGVKCSSVGSVFNGTRAQRIDLAQSDVFRRASEIAESVHSEGTMNSDEFIAVAGRDAGVKALNNALNEGKNVAGGISTFTIIWNESEPLCPASSLDLRHVRKPWWKLW